jgi:hypothetical protein
MTLRRQALAMVGGLVLQLGVWGTAMAQAPADTTVQNPDVSPPPTTPAPAAPVSSTEPDYPRGRISGILFGDIYYNVEGDPEHRYSSTGADSALTSIDGSTTSDGTPRNIGQDLSGVLIRRIYIQGDNDLSAKINTRWRLEVDSKELTTPGLKISTFVKNAYVQFKNVVPGGNALFGMLTTPIYETADVLWGYRSIEKTIADFRGLASSSDLGVQMKGFVDADHRIGYSAMVGTGTGQRPENNRYKRYYFGLPLRPIEGLTLEPYVDFEDFPGVAERTTYKAAAGYEFRRFAIGGEVVDQARHTAGATTEPFGFSVFARGKLGSTFAGYARFDRWQPNTRAANRVDSDLYIAGLDWEPHKDVHLMPNVVATQYHARGTALAPPHHDLQARITVDYRWSKP